MSRVRAFSSASASASARDGWNNERGKSFRSTILISSAGCELRTLSIEQFDLVSYLDFLFCFALLSSVVMHQKCCEYGWLGELLADAYMGVIFNEKFEILSLIILIFESRLYCEYSLAERAFG